MVTDPSLLEAYLYDWNNEERLRNQRADVDFWASVLTGRRRSLVVGCGTGRVSSVLQGLIPGQVVGVDLKLGRVRLANAMTPASSAVGDARALPVGNAVMDAVIFPYSVFQLLIRRVDRLAALSEATRVIRDHGTICIDVSQNFERRSASHMVLVAAGWSAALQTEVREWESVNRRQQALEIQKTFDIGGIGRVSFTEQWIFASALGIDELAQHVPVQLEEIRHGYGQGMSPHRSIYVFRRLPRSTSAHVNGGCV